MADRFTEFHVIYDMSDITALADSTPTTQDNKSFADISLLKDMEQHPGQMTLEHNYCILDGMQEEFDDEPVVAFFTKDMSDENGDFETIPTIDVTFTEVHSSYAFTINFIDDYPLQVRCTWWQDDTLIYRGTFDVTENNFIVDQDIQSYNKIKIEFLKALPYRYIKVNFIRYGMLIHWSENEIRHGNLNLETNRLSNQLSVNTLDFDFVDVADPTNPGNTRGLHNYFQRTQVMYPYELINGQKIDLGKYFLDSFSYEKNICKINGISYMGLFDTVPYNNGTMYNGVKAGVILDDIFDTLGITHYTIDDETYDFLVYGTLAPTNCKKAIEAILFVCHSVIDTTDLDNIQIYKSTTSIAGIMPKNIKMNTRVTRNNYISGIEVKYSKYTLGIQTSDVVKGTYDAGTHKVVFSTPYANYTASQGVTILNSSEYYVEFSVAATTQVIISANQYQATQNAITVSRPYIEAGEGENVKSFTTTLCNEDSAKELATQILNYYNNRLEIEVKYLASSLDMNERYIIENPTAGMDNYIGIFTERNIDLTGGFIDNAKFIGYYDKANYQYFIRETVDPDLNDLELITNDSEVI